MNPFTENDPVKSALLKTTSPPEQTGPSLFTKIEGAAGCTLTLPAIADAQAGWNCRVIVSTVTTSNNYIVTELTSADTNKIVSHMGILEIDNEDDGLHSAAHTTITFEGTPAKGDYIEILCDGTFYYAKGLGVSDDFVAVA